MTNKYDDIPPAELLYQLNRAQRAKIMWMTKARLYIAGATPEERASFEALYAGENKKIVNRLAFYMSKARAAASDARIEDHVDQGAELPAVMFGQVPMDPQKYVEGQQTSVRDDRHLEIETVSEGDNTVEWLNE